MDYIKVLSMLSNPQYRQTAEIEITNTLRAYGLTDQESTVFIANTLHRTPIQELSSKLTLSNDEIHRLYDSGVAKVKSKLNV